MGFPKSVEVKALTKCKRHCCLCEKNVKTKIELHHIKQKSKGGKDTFENCIPLCFDCHAEVGSYNIEHPKGKKYSEEELKKLRDDFYNKIENGFVNGENLSDSDFKKLEHFKREITDIVEEIVDVDFAAEPFRLSLLDDVMLIIEKWKKKKYSFDNINIETDKNEIISQFQYLSNYLTGTNDYFHLIAGSRLMFNNHPLEKLEELRSETIKIRQILYSSLNKIYEY